LTNRPTSSDLARKSILPKSDYANIPLSIEKVKLLLDFLRNHGGLVAEGIFRISANAVEQRIFWDTMREGKMVLKNETSIHLVASILKLYIREQSEPVIPLGHYESFVQSASNDTPENIEKKLKLAVTKLPSVNQVILGSLFEFFYEVIQNKEQTKNERRSTWNNLGTKSFAIT